MSEALRKQAKPCQTLEGLENVGLGRLAIDQVVGACYTGPCIFNFHLSIFTVRMISELLEDRN